MPPDAEVHAILRELVHGPGAPAKSFAPRLRLRDDLGLDSVALVDLLVAIETRCGIWFDPLQTDAECVFRTVGTLLRYVRARAKGLEKERREAGRAGVRK